MDIQREEPWWKWPAVFCGVSFLLGIGAGFLMFELDLSGVTDTTWRESGIDVFYGLK